MGDIFWAGLNSEKVTNHDLKDIVWDLELSQNVIEAYIQIEEDKIDPCRQSPQYMSTWTWVSIILKIQNCLNRQCTAVFEKYTNKLPFYDIRLTCKASKSHFGTGPCMNTYLKNSGNAVFFSSRLFQKKSSTSLFSHFTKMNESGDTTIHLDRWDIEKKKGALTLLETLLILLKGG
ncbi:hypothetical protein Prudu_505S000600 [Prunus dulcis]|uniref:Uncharacterized protein n=1 Tax=Prunus dulcis TaxID=3755 RepID=A0A5H2XKA8_PRUDU|nr:hypothetical protein Prudu_505S000600 [Prunus dulcis]